MTAPDEKTLTTLTRLFEEEFGPIGDRQVLYVHAPGRSEISGNHTDHEGGHVIAGSLDVAVDGIAVATDSNKVRVADEGYPLRLRSRSTRWMFRSPRRARPQASCVVWPTRSQRLVLSPRASTLPLPAPSLRAAVFRVLLLSRRHTAAPWKPSGAHPQLARLLRPDEPAHREQLLWQALRSYGPGRRLLGRPCLHDFEDQAQPKTQKLELNFEDHGYALVLVKVGADHVAATDDYAAVPREMQDVAAEFGKARLCEVNVADFDAKLPELRAKLGDRACLRAVHYWYENGLVDKRWAALNAGDSDQFLVLTRESGASSAMYLQNVVAKLGAEQPSMYALALAEHVLDGRGAVRIHGGGFGGTIQAFVPLDLVDTFITKMNGWLGKGSARHYAISDKGAYAAWL